VVVSVTPWRFEMPDHSDPENSTATDALVEEALVEEVSIDGMCGVY
jgi:mycofactocin precursor